MDFKKPAVKRLGKHFPFQTFIQKLERERERKKKAEEKSFFFLQFLNAEVITFAVSCTTRKLFPLKRTRLLLKDWVYSAKTRPYYKRTDTGVEKSLA